MDSAAAMTSTSRTQPLRLGLEHHPAQPRVDRQLRPAGGRAAVSRGRPSLRRRRRIAPSSCSRATPSLTAAPVGRLDERERGDVAEVERGHLQDDRGEVGAQDLRVGELRPGLEVVLGVEPDADAVGRAAAAALALVGRGLRDRLDRQPLHLEPLAVAGDAGRAGVDDVPDARHGQRGLGDVGRQHDPPAGVGLEDPVLLGRREPGVAAAGSPVSRRLPPAQRVGGVADLPLAGEEHQDVARPLGAQLVDRVADRLDLVADDLRRPRRRRRSPRPAGGSGPRPGRCGRRPRRSARRRSAARTARGSIVAEVMITLRSGRRGSSCLR